MKRSLASLFVWLLLLCLGTAPLPAQHFFDQAGARRDSMRGFPELQRSFDRWARSVDLSKQHGWKWYKRWEAFNAIRANADGGLADPEIYWREAGAIAERKRSATVASDGAGWSPVGPLNLSSRVTMSMESGIGRINCMAFHPTNPDIFWVGVAQGGVWKTVNGGKSWTPLTDDLPILRISDIAVDPQHPDTIYIAVGDYAYIGVDLQHDNRKRNTHYGLGIYRTTDGGASWQPSGLGFKLTDYDASLIGKIRLRPDRPGHILATGAGGAWKSTDYGETWKQTDKRLIWDLDQSPDDGDVLYATTGFLYSHGTGAAGIIRSLDFGETWEDLNTGIPPRDSVQRIELAIAPTDPLLIYGVSCGLDGGFAAIYRSTDGGTSWEVRCDASNTPNLLGWNDGNRGADTSGGGWGNDVGGQGTYSLAIIVDANNSNRLFIGGVNIWGSEDGGANWDGVSWWVSSFGPSVHADHHFFTCNPVSGLTYVCNDGGLSATSDMKVGSWNDAKYGGGTWPTVWENLGDGLAITSFYRIGLSAGNPGYVIGGAQDNSTYFYDTQSWTNLFGGDGMECMIDPNDPNVIYGSSQNGWLSKSTDGGATVPIEMSGLTTSILNTGTEHGEWTTPFALDPKSPNILYGAFGNLWRTDGDDKVWRRISEFQAVPELGSPTVSTALAISPSDPNYIYLAKRPYQYLGIPGQLWATSDGGGNWRNVSAGLPDSLYLTYIAPHATDPLTAWVTCGSFYDGVKVYKTTDAGKSWSNISRNLPNLPVNCIVYEAGSPHNTVYVGTDIGVYYTNDLMTGWSPFNRNLPNVIVSELEIQYSSKKLYAATFGRGIWVSDLADGASGVARESLPLASMEVSVEPNPAPGDFTIRLKDVPVAGDVTVEIVDVTGRRVHIQTLAATTGVYSHRFDLNLPYGLYFVRVTRGTSTKVARFTVVR